VYTVFVLKTFSNKRNVLIADLSLFNTQWAKTQNYSSQERFSKNNTCASDSSELHSGIVLFKSHMIIIFLLVLLLWMWFAQNCSIYFWWYSVNIL